MNKPPRPSYETGVNRQAAAAAAAAVSWHGNTTVSVRKHKLSSDAGICPWIYMLLSNIHSHCKEL
ncbi:hypothetical protein JOB18_038621 [Solea senegalensis]|uniref:Uncharacterized protein n=1 Tax=Solea senegalensis TaxID=28829 RepID=A0AAV6SAY4_SOLSE|nr:hypothetical protein JOB18_038621 [Solea senegalensis]